MQMKGLVLTASELFNSYRHFSLKIHCTVLIMSCP